LYPSHFYETFCLSAIEAQYANATLITSDIGALQDVVNPDFNIMIPGSSYSPIIGFIAPLTGFLADFFFKLSTYIKSGILSNHNCFVSIFSSFAISLKYLTIFDNSSPLFSVEITLLSSTFFTTYPVLFTNVKELSIFLNRKITNGDVYKIDRLYYIADKHKNNALSVTEEIKSLIKNSPELSKFQEREEKRPPKVIQTEYFSKTVVKPLSEKATISQVALKREVSEDKKPAPINGKPLGNFNRSSMVGKYAYIFYRYRLYEPLSNSDLRRLIIHDKFTDSSHYQAIHGLKKNGFIRQVEKGRQSTFVWTGDYAYPFSSMKTEDAAGMKYKPEEYFDLLKTSHIEQATETVTENVTIEKIVQNTEIKETKSEKEIPKVEIPAAAMINTSLILHKKIEPVGSVNSYNVSSAPTILLNRAVLLCCFGRNSWRRGCTAGIAGSG
jgi:hypothetical protein